MRELRIGHNDAGQRLDKFLNKTLKHFPMSLLYKSIRLKKIKVNRKKATPFQILEEGDSLQLFISEEFFESEDHTTENSLAKITPALDILYEDDHILLINKQPGVPSQEGEQNDGLSIETRVRAYLYQKGEYNPAKEQSFVPSLCNRIDRNTSGIVIAAKTAEALRIMDEKIRLREIEKYYLCVVHGTPKVKEALLKGYLIKNEKEHLVHIYEDHPPKGAKEILTKYRVLKTNGDLSLLEVHLLTGRTHQIRAHLAYIGHPLLGEGKYAENEKDKKRGYTYQALCSYKLKFTFKTLGTCLDHLQNRVFEIPKEQIYFVKELF